LEGEVTHDAVEDAWDVIQVLRKSYWWIINILKCAIIIAHFLFLLYHRLTGSDLNNYRKKMRYNY
jgi:hypothetical protein